MHRCCWRTKNQAEKGERTEKVAAQDWSLWRPNRARNVRRLEIAYLREQLEKLQLDLHTLQKQKSRKNDVQQLTTSTMVTAQIPSMWQTIAESQRRRREGSELENVRLKLIVDRQQKVADNLRKLLQKRVSQLVRRIAHTFRWLARVRLIFVGAVQAGECISFMDVSAPKPQIVRVLDFRGDIADFEALFRLNEAAYREMDAIFADNGLSNMVMSPSDVHIREGVGSKYLELFANKLLPFSQSDAREQRGTILKAPRSMLAMEAYTKNRQR
ncbi:hypothetical protein AM588_10004422 [Phytophthora nicotianae]|uniref:Uncharacterized protein n=1 Tax=Phytophthora nicotianae TaxID=4792 RepID=A0A0W8DCN9_PHYNI|nr:hypothetical protein AM588_10004422 [Phytophthora nicotianae]